MMKFKSSLKGGQNMAPFIKAVGDDMSTAGEVPSGLPTSTSARVQPAKPLAPFGGCEAPFSSTTGLDANRSGHMKVRTRHSDSHIWRQLCPPLFELLSAPTGYRCRHPGTTTHVGRNGTDH